MTPQHAHPPRGTDMRHEHGGPVLAVRSQESSTLLSQRRAVAALRGTGGSPGMARRASLLIRGCGAGGGFGTYICIGWLSELPSSSPTGSASSLLFWCAFN